MKHTFLALAILATNCLWMTTTHAAPKKFTGTDYSGVYSCVGSNAKIGSYKLMATLVLNKSTSHSGIGNYHLTMETENSTIYNGQAIANGPDMALTIEIIDGDNQTFSTGIAHLTQLKQRRYRYTHQYYETNMDSAKVGTAMGNYGSENCLMRKPRNRLH